MSTFHHAYNGIPTVDNSQAVCFDADTFGYRSLDHIARDRLSGFIDIEITTMTRWCQWVVAMSWLNASVGVR